ncbi:MAG: plasmid stabilization protein [Rhizobiaceae bacterium]
MAQLLIRNIDEDVKENLRKRARRHGTSMESYARDILRAELLRPENEVYGLGTRIAELFKNIPDNDDPLPELPDDPLRPAKFDE